MAAERSNGHDARVSAVDGGSSATRRRRPRRWLRVTLTVLAVVALCLALEAVALVRMRGELASGRRALQDARRSLLAGDIDAAAGDFGQAGSRFAAATDRANGVLGRVAAAIPLAGNTMDVASALADAGGHLSTAGTDLSAALRRVPGGIDALAPSHGRLPLDAYATLEGGLGSARAEATAAATALDQAPTSLVAGPALDALWDAQVVTDDTVRTLTAADLLVRGLPAFAGGAGERRYLVVAQNPAELRGTGGIWGAYAILAFRDGRLTISDTAPIQELANPNPTDVPAPSADYARNYDQFGGAASWHNVNMTPDFPSAAQAALANYEVGQGERLDGVIAVDPFAFRSMLTVTGPVSIPEVGGSLGATNVVDFTTNRAYSLFPSANDRKLVLGAVASAVLQRFLELDGKGVPRLRALGRAASGGHLLVYSTDRAFEQGLQLSGAGSSFDDPIGSDIAAVTVNNASASKVDFYAVRSVSYDVRLGGDHDASGDLTARIRNEAPTSGQPPYVIGPFVHDASPGDQIPLITEWCHDPCQLVAARRDGHVVAVAPGTENGVAWFRDYRTIPAGQTGSFAISTHTTGVWEGNSSGGTYRLTFHGQPTIRPTTLDLSITAPSGTRIVWTSTPMTVNGSTATWIGDPGATLTVEVRFRAPLPLRVVRDLTRRVFGT
jgi:hypothetical protein